MEGAPAQSLITYSDSYQPQVKDLVVSTHEEFGFKYDPVLDADLEDPNTAYVEDGGVFYLFVENHKLLGTVAVRKVDPETAEIKRMYVAKDRRGSGLGARLLDKALAFCKESGFKRVVLDTHAAQADAQALYKSRGFEVTHEKTDSIFMEKQLLD